MVLSIGAIKSKAGLVSEVTNTAPVANNANFLKVKGEEGGGKEKWWSIGRGRKDSKEKTKEKENKISHQCKFFFSFLLFSLAYVGVVAVEYIHNPNPPHSKSTMIFILLSARDINC